MFHSGMKRGHDIVRGAEGREKLFELKTVRLVRPFGQGQHSSGLSMSQRLTGRNKNVL